MVGCHGWAAAVSPKIDAQESKVPRRLAQQTRGNARGETRVSWHLEGHFEGARGSLAIGQVGANGIEKNPTQGKGNTEASIFGPIGRWPLGQEPPSQLWLLKERATSIHLSTPDPNQTPTMLPFGLGQEVSLWWADKTAGTATREPMNACGLPGTYTR